MIKQKWTLIAGTVLIAGALATGAAFASAPTATGKLADRQVHKLENLSEGQKQLLQQMHERRRHYMEQFRAEAKTMIEQAVKEGKITQEEGEKLQQKGARFHGKKSGKFKGSSRGMNLNLIPEDEVRSHLEQAITTGKFTQDQADLLLQTWLEQKNPSN